MPDLWAPEGYAEARGCECGRPGWHRDLVPDSLLGLDIKPACCIHDFMYTYPNDAGLDYKAIADHVFLNNMLRLIEAGTKQSWLKRLRSALAWLYYQGVVAFGGPSFWAGKNDPANLIEIDRVRASISDRLSDSA